MTHITISDETARLIGKATTPVVLVDSRGRQVGRVTRISTLPADASDDAIAAEIQRRIAADDGSRFDHAQVIDHLKSVASE